MSNNSLPTIDEILDATYNHGRMADKKLSETKPGDILPWMTHEYAKQQLDKLMLQERLETLQESAYMWNCSKSTEQFANDLNKLIGQLELLIKGGTK